jgi:hypothetical protein
VARLGLDGVDGGDEQWARAALDATQGRETALSAQLSPFVAATSDDVGGTSDA